MSNDTIKEITEAVNKEYKTSPIGTFGEHEAVNPKLIISTGNLSTDIVVGNGGFVQGSIVEIYGPESSGKTSLALFTIAEAQKEGKVCAFIDMEHALDMDLAKAYGVNTEDLIFDQPDCGEEALGKAEALCQTSKVAVIVIDSVDACVPRCTLEGEMGDSNMGKQAKLMSQALRILTPLAAKTNTLIIFINQIRMKIGLVFGNPETTSGGQALKFYSTYRLDVRRKEPITVNDVVVGSKTKIACKKNKRAAPFRECIIELMFGKGVDRDKDFVDTAVGLGIIEKKGAWYFFNNEQLGQGNTKTVEFLKNNIDIYDKIKYTTLESMKIKK